MTTATKREVNRGYLMKMARAGRLYLKCKYHYTDDYAWDAQVNFCKSDEFVKVYFREEYKSPLEDLVNAAYASGYSHAEVEPLMVKLSAARQQYHNEQNELARGMIQKDTHDFRGKCGGCYGTKQAGMFYVHSNLSYEFEVR